MAKAKKPRLGRGLNSLMAGPAPLRPPDATQPPSHPGEPPRRPPEESAAAEPAGPGPEREATAQEVGLEWAPVGAIEPNPYQPRRGFDEEALGQLAASIRQDGVMQPIVVRRRPDASPGADGPVYQLVAGERRWRAVRLAGLERVPAIVRDLDDRQLAEWAVIENLQREDLNPMEQAEAFARLIDRFGLSHQDVADRVGVSRSAVSNTLRLLDLHHDVRELVRAGRLSSGHGRGLVGIADDGEQVALARRAAEGGWSVRMVEDAVRRAERSGGGSRGGAAAGRAREARSAHLSDLERQIADQLQTKVRIRAGRKKNSGTISIEFYDLDHFDGLLEKLGVRVE